MNRTTPAQTAEGDGPCADSEDAAFFDQPEMLIRCVGGGDPLRGELDGETGLSESGKVAGLPH
jgi:hypothetical protein